MMCIHLFCFWSNFESILVKFSVFGHIFITSCKGGENYPNLVTLIVVTSANRRLVQMSPQTKVTKFESDA